MHPILYETHDRIYSGILNAGSSVYNSVKGKQVGGYCYSNFLLKHRVNINVNKWVVVMARLV